MQIKSLQFLRAVAAILVVLYHMELWEHHDFGAGSVTPTFFSIGHSGVDLFFVISGFIMVYIQAEPIRSLYDYIRFLIHRVSRIYPPFWLVMIPLTVAWCVKPQLFNNYNHNQVDVLRSWLLLPQNFVPLLNVSWTLIHEMYFYIVVSIALLLSPRRRMIFGVGWFVLVCVGLTLWGSSQFGQNRWLQIVFSPFSLTFLLGYFLGLNRERLSRLSSTWAFLLVAVGAVGLLNGYSIVPQLGIYPDNNLLARFLFWGIPCGFLVAGSVALEHRFPRALLKLVIIGDASYALYLLHAPLVPGFYRVLSMSKDYLSPFAMVLAAIICFLLTLVSAYLFHVHVEKPTAKKVRNILERIANFFFSRPRASVMQTASRSY